MLLDGEERDFEYKISADSRRLGKKQIWGRAARRLISQQLEEFVHALIAMSLGAGRDEPLALLVEGDALLDLG